MHVLILYLNWNSIGNWQAIAPELQERLQEYFIFLCLSIRWWGEVYFWMFPIDSMQKDVSFPNRIQVQVERIIDA